MISVTISMQNENIDTEQWDYPLFWCDIMDVPGAWRTHPCTLVKGEDFGQLLSLGWIRQIPEMLIYLPKEITGAIDRNLKIARWNIVWRGGNKAGVRKKFQCVPYSLAYSWKDKVTSMLYVSSTESWHTGYSDPLTRMGWMGPNAGGGAIFLTPVVTFQWVVRGDWYSSRGEWRRRAPRINERSNAKVHLYSVVREWLDKKTRELTTDTPNASHLGTW